MTRKDKKKLKIAKSILDLNENAALTGSLALMLQSRGMTRETGDIDILMIDDFAPNIQFPMEIVLNSEVVGEASDGSGYAIEYDGIKIDIISGNKEDTVKIDGIRCCLRDSIFKIKEIYSKQDNSSALKHVMDLEDLSW